MGLRQERGKQILKTMGKYIKQKQDGSWSVPSQSSNNLYSVSEDFVCSCPDSQKRTITCKHAYALRYYLQAEKPNGELVHKQRLTYKQAWGAYTQAQTQEIRLFDELLKDLVSGVQEPAQIGAGRRKTPLDEALFCAIQKVYSQLSSRRAASLYFNANEKQQIGKAPNYNVINKLLNQDKITPILHELLMVTALPLKAVETHFSPDSTGFRTTQFNEYCNQKHGVGRQHRWVKCHAIVGTKTNIITSTIVTPEYGEGTADGPQLPVLVQATANGGFTVKEVSADKGYSSAENYNSVAELGGRAYIPFKENASGNSHGIKYRLWRKAYHYFELNKDDFYSHYHARSNVESTFAAIKKKFGDSLKSKNWKAQENELLCKLIAYNITVLIHEMFELGIKPDFSETGGIN